MPRNGYLRFVFHRIDTKKPCMSLAYYRTKIPKVCGTLDCARSLIVSTALLQALLTSKSVMITVFEIESYNVIFLKSSLITPAQRRYPTSRVRQLRKYTTLLLCPPHTHTRARAHTHKSAHFKLLIRSPKHPNYAYDMAMDVTNAWYLGGKAACRSPCVNLLGKLPTEGGNGFQGYFLRFYGVLRNLRSLFGYPKY